jgi:hypothetical protein
LDHFAENNLKAAVNERITGVLVVKLGVSYMFAIEPAARSSSKEKLAAIGIWPSIGHGQQSRYLRQNQNPVSFQKDDAGENRGQPGGRSGRTHVVLVLEVLIGKFPAVDAFA